jgi:DNA (cytosine-5)-methyltransferase 1
MSLSNTNGLNDYFLFNDIRNGHTTIHSWDIIATSQRQKEICLLLLKNRRKSCYGELDGNPLSLKHLQSLDPSIKQQEIDDLVELEILKPEDYRFQVNDYNRDNLTEDEAILLSSINNQEIVVDQLKKDTSLKIKRLLIAKILKSLQSKEVIHCTEIRYDFKNSKISTGLFGVNRIFLPTSNIFPTLVASDTNDFVALKSVQARNQTEFKHKFIKEIYQPKCFRKISQEEACLIQGFPKNFKLPKSRAKWMKLVGNSVSVPVIDQLCKAIIDTGIFDS